MKIESREYKMLIRHEGFFDPREAVSVVWEEIESAVETIAAVRTKGKFDEKESRRIVFLDTPDNTLRRNGLLLRQRTGERVEYTLKCRSEDRYFAAGTDVRPAAGLAGEAKLEEDIASPFRCRFSHSATITFDDGSGDELGKTPRTLGDAARLFPTLGTLRADDRPCNADTTLGVVNNIKVDETVWKGAKLAFDRDGDEKPEKATLAVMVWTRGKSAAPGVAELSFRLKDDGEQFSRGLALAARAVYAALQRMDCARPGAMTKTEYIYRDSIAD